MKIPIEKFQEQGGRVVTDDLDFESFRSNPLPANVLPMSTHATPSAPAGPSVLAASAGKR